MRIIKSVVQIFQLQAMNLIESNTMTENLRNSSIYVYESYLQWKLLRFLNQKFQLQYNDSNIL